MLNRAGTTAEGTTVSDFDESEQRQQRSVGLALAPLVHEGVKVNLLDAPGYADFVGELRAGLRAADCALFVLAANEGVDAPTVELWRECAEVGMPRVVVVTKLDHARADYDGVVRQAREAFGDKVLPVFLREGDGLVGLITGDHGHDEERAALIEGVIEESEDEMLMERYVGGEDVDAKLLVADLEKAVARGSFHPVVPVDSATGVGARQLLDLVVSGFPSPSEHPAPEVFTPAGKPGPALVCDPDGPLVAEVVKTTSDPYVGRVSLVRVFSGTLRPDATVHVSGHLSDFYGPQDAHGGGHDDHDEDERIGALSVPLGKTLRPAEVAVAGDICAIGRLSRAETGDTLSDAGAPLVLRPWTMPEPLLPLAVAARAKTDEDKLAQGLARLVAEDPALRVEHNAETHQIVLWTMGEAHADVLLDRLERRHGVAVDQVELRVPLRETFAEPASGHGRHVKQSGGHGQFAVCDIEVEPLPGGSGLEFVDKVVGGCGAAPVHPLGGEGRPGADGAGPRRGPSGRRHPGDPHRRQVAQRRLLGHGLPDRGSPCPEGRCRRRAHLPARAGRRAGGARAGRPGRHRDERPVRSARQGAGLRAGRRRPHRRPGGGAPGGAEPLRGGPPGGVARRRVLHAQLRALRAGPRRTSRAG